MTNSKAPKQILIIARRYMGDNVFTSPVVIYPLLADEARQIVVLQYNKLPQKIYNDIDPLLKSRITFVNYDGFCKTVIKLRALGCFDIVINLSKTSFSRRLLTLCLRAKVRYNTFFSPVKCNKIANGKRVRTYKFADNAFMFFSNFTNKLLGANFSYKDVNLLHQDAGKEDKGYVLLCPGASGAYKTWSLQNFIDLSLALQTKGQRVWVLSGSAKSELIAAERIPAEKIITGEAEFSDIKHIIKNAGLVVANDSGFMHLSAMLGVQTLGVFAQNSPEVYGYPFMPNFKSITAKGLVCHPCGHAKAFKLCPFNNSNAAAKQMPLACIASISVKDVLFSMESFFKMPL